jgi:hypothetical protein
VPVKLEGTRLAVFARMVLPAEIAWSYRRGRGAVGAAVQGPARRLLVSDVQPPAHLPLPRLSPWLPGEVEIIGVEKNPATGAKTIVALKEEALAVS